MLLSAAPEQVQQVQRSTESQPRPAGSSCSHFTARQTPRALRELEQHRLRCRGISATPARFEDLSHVAYYQPTIAGSRKGKVTKRVEKQRSRLRELSSQLPLQPSETSLAAIVNELQAMSENLSDVSKVINHSYFVLALPRVSQQQTLRMGSQTLLSCGCLCGDTDGKQNPAHEGVLCTCARRGPFQQF